MSRHKRHSSKHSLLKVKNPNRVILLNIENFETRVALIEGGKLAELIVERNADRGIIGNIYKGRVDRVVPGIGAAFVDIGFGKNVFLYVSDIYYDMKSYESLLDEPEENGGTNEIVSIPEEPAAEDEPAAEIEEEIPTEGKGKEKKKRREYKPPVAIEDLIRKGQELLVQIVKEPLGKKGARATTHITLPGRFLVLMPTIRHIGISRRIQQPEERDRLKELIRTLLPEGMGVIVRTAAQGATEEEFRRDCVFLTNLWEKIQKRGDTMHAPNLIHQDLGLSFRIVRDLFKEEIDSLIIDSEEVYDEIRELVTNISPELLSRIQYHDSSDPLFDVYDVESQIDKLLHRKIWMKSGGHIYIDEAEALVAIDVNTGKFSGGQDLEETVLKTNVEAAQEVAHQIRARGLGGLIVIDFIDMRSRSNQHKVHQAFLEALKNDRERFNVLEMTEVGLIQMTRRRVRPSVLKTLTQSCPYCDGDGVILSGDTMAIKVLRELNRVCRMTGKPKIVVKVHPDLSKFLNEEMETELIKLSESHRKTISIVPDDKMHFEKYNVELLDI